jgi:hypothetical protein
MMHILVGSNDDDFDAVVDAAKRGGAVRDWVVPKTAAVGDRVFLFTREHGFVASASIVSKGTPGEFGKKQVYRADVGPVVLLPCPVPLAYVTSILPQWGWATYPRSYTTPPESICDALDGAIDDFQSGLGPGEPDQPDTYTEGKMRRALAVRYERDPEARAACIRHYGAVCAVCGFAYGEIYGPKVDGLIVVHHLTPVAARGEQYKVDPVADLRPVCADCHLVIHRRAPPFTIAEVRLMMEEAAESVSQEGIPEGEEGGHGG